MLISSISNCLLKMIAPNKLEKSELHIDVTYARNTGMPIITTMFKNPIPPREPNPTSKATAAIARVKNLRNQVGRELIKDFEN